MVLVPIDTAVIEAALPLLEQVRLELLFVALVACETKLESRQHLGMFLNLHLNLLVRSF